MIGCDMEADTLTKIEGITSTVGMTHQAIQDERLGPTEFSISSFSQLHGEKWSSASRQAHEYCATMDFEKIIGKLLEFVTTHQVAFQNSL